MLSEFFVLIHVIYHIWLSFGATSRHTPADPKMSMADLYSDPDKLSFKNTVYGTSVEGLDMSEFKICEDWNGRPASEWSWKSINLLLSKIENYERQLYHSRTYGRKKVQEFIPLNKLISLCNESFGYNGWSTEVMYVHSNKSEKPIPPKEQEELKNDILKKKRAKLELDKTISSEDVKNEENVDQAGDETDGTTDDMELGNIDTKYQVVSEARTKIILKDGTYLCSLGFAQHTSLSAARSLERSRRESVNKSLKNAILSFDGVILEYENKIQNNFYQDGLFGANNYKPKQEND